MGYNARGRSALGQRLSEEKAAREKAVGTTPHSAANTSTQTSTNTVDEGTTATKKFTMRARGGRNPEDYRTEQTDEVDVPLAPATPSFLAYEDFSPTKPATPSTKEETPETPSTPPASPTIDYDIKSNIKPNPLSSVENGTYNFKFFMTHELAVFDTLSKEQLVVIAESGSTGFYITEVDMDTVIAPSLITRNTTATDIKIKIIEPFGTSLFDDIRQAALSLNVLDHRSAPMWLSVSFKGYTPATEDSHEGGEIKDLSDETRTWKLIIRKIDAEMTLGGTEYTFVCAAKGEQGLLDASRRLEKMQPITATTMGDFFTSLAENLNKNDNYSTKTSISDMTRIRKYAFSFPTGNSEYSDMLNWKLRGSSNEQGKKSETILKNVDGKGVYTFTQGTAIESLIQEVLSTTEEAQSLLIFGIKNGKVDGGIGVDVDEKDILKPSIAFVIEPTVDIISYNAIANDYNILINYHIVPYKTFIPIVSQDHIENAQDSKNSKERLKQLATISNMKKIYHYMYTGQNTEVLDFKIELNNLWFVGLPLYQGQANHWLATSSTNEADKAERRIIQDKENNQLTETKLLASVDLLEEKVRDEAFIPTNAESATKRLETTRTDLVVVQEKIKNTDENAYNHAVQSQSNIPIDDAISTFSFGASRQSLVLENDIAPSKSYGIIESSTIGATDLVKEVAARSGRSPSGSIVFAEDLDILSESLVDTSEQQLNKTVRGQLRSELSATSSQSEVGVEGNAGNGRSFFSALMNQVYGNRGHLVEIELEIKGDPYWLGIPDERKRISRTDPDNDLTNADAYLILTFGFPTSISDGGVDESEYGFAGTGMYDITIKENGFNGIYRVKSVSNSFSGGKFTQRLSAVIDELTKEEDIIDLVKENDIT